MSRRTPGLVIVTPEMAQLWLSKSRQSVSHVKIDRYVERILNGDWDPDMHYLFPITISPGRLHNGNHRLHAVVKAGVPAMMWVEGEPPCQ